MPAYPRNEPCPCGSGKKYKRCCSLKGIEYAFQGGRVVRSVPLNAELREGLERLRERFIAKFGREPGPDDPIFFDPDAPGDTPQPIDMQAFESEVTKAMTAVGVADAHVYAYRKTGLILTEENMKLLPDRDIEEYFAAVDEFEALFSKTEKQ